MNIGVLSDIHGNIVALEAVLSDMPAVDGLVCAGDVVGYNPWHGDCVDALRERNVPTVMGNHDRAVVTETGFAFNSMAGAGVRHARETLTDEQIGWLSELPTTRREFGGRVRIAHGHPDDPDRYTYPAEFSDRLLSGEDVLVLGHTHVQGHKRVESGLVMNPGSVGQPRDGDPKAAYAVVDVDSLTVRERRISYDINRVQQAVDDAGLPAQIGDRLHNGR